MPATRVGAKSERCNLPEVSAAPEGRKGTYAYRVDILCGNKRASAWHDLPLFVRTPCNAVTFVCEIPRDTVAKMEVVTDEPGNPIRQDKRKSDGRLRRYATPMPWNYGMLPRTWEDPDTKPSLGMPPGDNDPVDVVEVGSLACTTGGAYAVKPLAAFALVDGGELDWKVIAVRCDDPMAHDLNNVHDLQRILPGALDNIRSWFRDYKMLEGKPRNTFLFNGRALDTQATWDVIRQTHAQYMRKMRKMLKMRKTQNMR